MNNRNIRREPRSCCKCCSIRLYSRQPSDTEYTILLTCNSSGDINLIEGMKRGHGSEIFDPVQIGRTYDKNYLNPIQVLNLPPI